MNVRSAQLSDIGRIEALYQQLFTEMSAFQPDRWLPAEQAREFIENAVTDEKFHLLVAEQDGKIAGFVIAQTQETPAYSCVRPRRFGYVFDIVVYPAVRGQGTGKALLSAVKAWSKAQGHTHLELSVLPENKGAMRLYEQEGYRAVLYRLAITL